MSQREIAAVALQQERAASRILKIAVLFWEHDGLQEHLLFYDNSFS